MSIIGEIKAIQARSANAWEMAVDTAGPEYPGGSVERAAELQSLADACDEAYEAAVDTLEGQYDGWASAAQLHLEEARSLESDGGDASHAIEALEALADYAAEDAADEAEAARVVRAAAEAADADEFYLEGSTMRSGGREDFHSDG